MIKMPRGLFLVTFFLLSINNWVVANDQGYIKGKLSLDTTWSSNIYMSYLETIEREYAVSQNMIIGSSEIDSLGNFFINLESLPSGWCFVRLHVVKNGIPPASLVVGGMDENYFFLVANSKSKIEIKNTEEIPIFSEVSSSGAPYMETFNLIEELSDYSNTLTYDDALIEKEFIEAAVSDKLKAIADTSSNPLVSLYAMYKSDFNLDFDKGLPFYKSYLAKWETLEDAKFLAEI